MDQNQVKEKLLQLHGGALIKAAREGKSVSQAKQAAAKPAPPEADAVSLGKEKQRLERTIDN